MDRDKNKSIFIPGLEDYIDDQLVQRPFPFMKAMEADAAGRKLPIISAATGSVLAHLIRMIAPRRILELGTGPGYSLLWMISATDNSEIVSVDRNLNQTKEAGRVIAPVMKSGVKVEILCDDVMQYLKTSRGTLSSFDMVFIDCDKVIYPEILSILLEAGPASLVFDNSLWHGRIASDDNRLPSDIAVRDFWNRLKESNRRWTLFPSGDGLVLIE